MVGEFGNDPANIVDIIEDPRTKPRTGATVIRLRTGRLDINTCPQLLVTHGKMYKPDATKVCSQGAGILADNLDPNVARALAAALEDVGEPCFVVAAAEVVPLPAAQVFTSAHLSKSELAPVDVSGKLDRCPWTQALVLSLAHVTEQVTETKAAAGNVLSRRVTGLGGFATAASMATGGTAMKRETVTRSAHPAFLEIVFGAPLRRYRIDGRHFDYSVLGDQLQQSSEANLRTLGRWFLWAAPWVRTNVDRDEMLATGQAPLPQLSEHQLDDLTHWLINLVHFGKAEVESRKW